MGRNGVSKMDISDLKNLKNSYENEKEFVKELEKKPMTRTEFINYTKGYKDAKSKMNLMNSLEKRGLLVDKPLSWNEFQEQNPKRPKVKRSVMLQMNKDEFRTLRDVTKNQFDVYNDIPEGEIPVHYKYHDVRGNQVKTGDGFQVELVDLTRTKVDKTMAKEIESQAKNYRKARREVSSIMDKLLNKDTE